jgi:hypothetical protein
MPPFSYDPFQNDGLWLGLDGSGLDVSAGGGTLGELSCQPPWQQADAATDGGASDFLSMLLHFSVPDEPLQQQQRQQQQQGGGGMMLHDALLPPAWPPHVPLSAPLPAALQLPPLLPLPQPLQPSPSAAARAWREQYAYDAPRVRAASVRVKLLSDAPADLPRDGLRPAALRSFGATSAWGNAAAASHAPFVDASGFEYGGAGVGAGFQAPLPLAMEGLISPGCTALHLEAVLDDVARAREGSAQREADRHNISDAHAGDILAAMMAEQGPSGAFLRARGREVRVMDAAGRVATACGGVIAAAVAARQRRAVGGGGAAAAAAARQQQQEQLPPVSPLALLSTAAAPLRLLRCAGQAHAAALDGCTLRATLHGQHVRFLGRVPPAQSDACAQEACGTFPATGAEGVARIYAARGSGSDSSGNGNSNDDEQLLPLSPAVVLLCRDAAIVEEVGATEALMLEAERTDSSSSSDMRARVQSALLALGHALRPGCAPTLAARAADAALSLGWRAAAARVLAAHAHYAAPELLLPHGVTLLHIAAQTGDAWAVRAVLHAGGEECVYGAPHSRCRTAAAATPLHVAATAADAGAAVATALTEHNAGAVVAWCTARCGRGRTPSDVARACGAPPPLLALDAALCARVLEARRVLAATRDVLCARSGACSTREQAALLAEDAFRAALLRSATHDALALADALLLSLVDHGSGSGSDAAAAVDAAPACRAPQPAAAASDAADFPAFLAAQAASSVHSVLCFCLLVIAYSVTAHIKRRSFAHLGPLPHAELLSKEVLSVEEMFRTMFLTHSWAVQPLTFALMALILCPSRRARAFYIRYNTPLLAAYWAAHFLLNMVYLELSFRVGRGIPPSVMRWPSWNNFVGVLLTGVSATLPMRAAPLCALLCARAALTLAGPRCGCWPVGEPFDGPGGWATQGRVNAALTAVAVAAVVRAERRAFAAWRAARRAHKRHAE